MTAPTLDARCRARASEHEQALVAGLWTAADAARFFGTSQRTVYTFVALGLPCIRLPGSGDRPILRFDPDECRAWAEARRSHSVRGVLSLSARRAG